MMSRSEILWSGSPRDLMFNAQLYAQVCSAADPGRSDEFFAVVSVTIFADGWGEVRSRVGRWKTGRLRAGTEGWTFRMFRTARDAAAFVQEMIARRKRAEEGMRAIAGL